MRHFEHLDDDARDALFSQQPHEIPADAAATEVGRWMGATLYLPASRPFVVADLVRQRAKGVVAAVIDFEDSVSDREALDSRSRAGSILHEMSACAEDLPMIFLRMRDYADPVRIVADAHNLPRRLAGFAFPKFDPAANGDAMLESLADSSRMAGRRLVGMPILETPALAFNETRQAFLEATTALLKSAEGSIACVRIGVTDIAGIFGLRRSPDTTIYDIKVVADVLTSVVNAFVRPSHDAIPVSGPVWEYFATSDRILKPRLRSTPFVDHQATRIRESMVKAGLDALLSEITLDRLNGLWGKTVIHPSHVGVVHALSVVSFEEHQDALAIVARESDGGVYPSPAGNKMNEVRPHMAWARSVLQRARIFGAARAEVDFVDFLLASGALESTAR